MAISRVTKRIASAAGVVAVAAAACMGSSASPVIAGQSQAQHDAAVASGAPGAAPAAHAGANHDAAHGADHGSVETRWVDPRVQGPRLHAPRQAGVHGLEPVDQAVGDLDSLSRSLRHIEAGHARFPEHARVYRLPPDAPGMWSRLGDPVRDQIQRHQRHTYRYEAPGVQAWVRQPDYIVAGEGGEPAAPGTPGQPLARNRPPQQQGQYLELVPADTIFDLTPPGAHQHPDPPHGFHTDDAAPDHRLDYRVDYRVDTRIDGEPSPAE